MAITPDVLPPESLSKSATTQKLVTPLSRRKFRKEFHWAYRTIQSVESIAYYTIPLYREGVQKNKNQFHGELTGYHQWVLLRIRKIKEKFADPIQTAEWVHKLEQVGIFTYREYQKDWINWID